MRYDEDLAILAETLFDYAKDVLEFRLRAVRGNRPSERNKGQCVCNPLSSGRMKPMHRRVAAAA